MLFSFKKVLEGLAEAIAEAPLLIVHFSVDLWTCKVSGKKFIGICIFWVTAKGVLKHALVAVRSSLRSLVYRYINSLLCYSASNGWIPVCILMTSRNRK